MGLKNNLVLKEFKKEINKRLIFSYFSLSFHRNANHQRVITVHLD
jgi:hypothetical protein